MRVRVVTEEEVVLLEHTVKEHGHEQIYSLSIASETKEGRCQFQIIDLEECLLWLGEFSIQHDFFLQSEQEEQNLQLLFRWPSEIGGNQALLTNKPQLLHQIKSQGSASKEITFACHQGAGKLVLLSFKKAFNTQAEITGSDTIAPRFLNEWRLNISTASVLQQLLYYPVTPLYLRQYARIKCEELYLMLLQERDAAIDEGSLPAAIAEKLKFLRELIRNNPDKNYSIDELTRHALLNKDHLKRYFKAYYGDTIHQYIILTKMEAAQQMLLYSKKAGKEIAFDLGYKSDAHFSGAFKKYFGITPGELRKRNTDNH